MGNKVLFDSLRSLVYTSISGTYAAVGTPLDFAAQMLVITNKTNGDMIFSTDSTNADGMMFIPAGVSRVYDLESNKLKTQDQNSLAVGTQLYVKQSSAPTSGSVYIEVVYS